MSDKKFVTLLSILGVVVLVLAVLTGIFIDRIASTQFFQDAVSQTGGSFPAIFDLQQSVAEAYPSQAVAIYVTNGRILTVSLTHSEINALPADLQAMKAKEIARFARNHFQAIEPIETIRVQLTHNQRFLFITLTQSTMHRFAIEVLN
ncbi:MAG TPA: hypothetical protein VFF68_13355 [Anaerolineaceae bacterium]|nr:hypothetical protein [Anaerolineaceae bacterium]